MQCIKRREDKYVRHDIICIKPNYGAVALNRLFIAYAKNIRKILLWH